MIELRSHAVQMFAHRLIAAASLLVAAAATTAPARSEPAGLLPRLEAVDEVLSAIEADIQAAGVTPALVEAPPPTPAAKTELCREKLEDIVAARRGLDARLAEVLRNIEEAARFRREYRTRERDLGSEFECGEDAMAMLARIEDLLDLRRLLAGVDEVGRLRTCIYDGKDRIDARRLQIERDETDAGLRSAKMLRLARVEESYDDEETSVDATARAYGKAADKRQRLLTEMRNERISCEAFEDF